MIKIRLHGTVEEIDSAVEIIKATFKVLSISGYYKDKGFNEYYRCYIDAEC